MSGDIVSAVGVVALSIGLLTGSKEQPRRPTATPTADLQPAPTPGRTIARGADGLFRIETRLNDVPVRLVVDTGATMTVLCAADARRAGLLDRRLMYDERIDTGGGHVRTARIRLASAKVMDKHFADVPILVAKARFPVSVMGQDLMRRLPPMTISGDVLVLNAALPAQGPPAT